MKPASQFIAQEPSVILEIEKILKDLGFKTVRSTCNVWYTTSKNLLEQIKDYLKVREKPELARNYFLKYGNERFSQDFDLQELMNIEEGKLLGYPKCCIQEYISRIRKISREGLESIRKKEDFSYYSRFPYISHIPCKECIENSESPTSKLNKLYKRSLSPWYEISEKSLERMCVKLKGPNPEYLKVETRVKKA